MYLPNIIADKDSNVEEPMLTLPQLLLLAGLAIALLTATLLAIYAFYRYTIF